MTALLELSDLHVAYGPDGRPARRGGRLVHAVNGVSFDLARGDALGILGETGAGKTTLAQATLRQIEAESGDIHFDDKPLRALRGKAFAEYRRKAQLIHQDAVGSLNPWLTVEETLAEPLTAHRLCRRAEVKERVAGLMALVGLPPELRRRRPPALSPADCRRVGIARALSLEPELVIADEPAAGFDVPIQTQILNLLAQLRQERGFTLIVTAREPSLLRFLCPRIAVMYLGRIVELGPTKELLRHPRHPYTQGLVAAMPDLSPTAQFPAPILDGEPASVASLPPGCAFHPRCARAKEICRSGLSPARRRDGPVTVWCHLYPEMAAKR
jgi:peptide/nickel transport system ATP-binding protein